MFENYYGNSLETGGSAIIDSSGLFSVNSVVLEKNVYVPFCGDGIYGINPYRKGGGIQTNDRIFVGFGLYDENKNQLFGGNAMNHYIYKVEGLKVWSAPLYNLDEFKEGFFVFGGEPTVMASRPAYIKYGIYGDANAQYSDMRMTYNAIDTEPVDRNLKSILFNDTNVVGFEEQMKESYDSKDIVDLDDKFNEHSRRIKSEIIRQMNHSRDAFRIATFNVYCAGHGQSNWKCLKDMLQNYGIDMVGMQEVRDPLGINDGNKVLSEEMESWQFPYFSDNGEAYPTNTRSLMSRFPVLSSYEWEFVKWSSDHRYCAKYEVSLPRYKDRVGSENIKLSIYNTQLEVYPIPADGGSATSPNRISEANEIIAEVRKDKNPFIIILGDTNDFSADKEIWKMFEAEGFTRCIPVENNTVQALDNSIDQIFICDRMKSLGYDVINGGDYKFYKSGNPTILSDHDLCFADIQFDYDFACIKLELADGYTSDCNIDWIEYGENLTVHLNKTPSNITVRVRDIQHNDYHSNGTITIPNINGDVLIRVKS